MLKLIARVPETIKLCCACVAILISILPFAAVTHLPFVDYPNHLARFYIYQHLGSDPYLSSFYEWHWAVQPTLALDVLILPFARFMQIEPAANFVVMLSLIVLYVGTIALDRQLHGKDWGVSIFSGVILYNGALRMGFINYVIGVSFAILLLALWLRFRPRLVIPPEFRGLHE